MQANPLAISQGLRIEKGGRLGLQRLAHTQGKLANRARLFDLVVLLRSMALVSCRAATIGDARRVDTYHTIAPIHVPCTDTVMTFVDESNTVFS